MVRFLMLALSGFFAGIAGGLSAINYEIVTGESLGAHTSALVLLMAFIGGVGQFYGPIIGAVLVTFLQTALSQYTHAWLFYFGLFFLFMVLEVPGGIASLVQLHREPWRQGLLGRMVAALPGDGHSGRGAAGRPGRPGRAGLRAAGRGGRQGRRRGGGRCSATRSTPPAGSPGRLALLLSAAGAWLRRAWTGVGWPWTKRVLHAALETMNG